MNEQTAAPQGDSGSAALTPSTPDVATAATVPLVAPAPAAAAPAAAAPAAAAPVPPATKALSPSSSSVLSAVNDASGAVANMMHAARPKSAPPKAAAQTPPTAGAILFLHRTNLRPILRQELKALAIGDVLTIESLDDCLSQLRSKPSAVLVVDWDHGVEVTARVLAAAQGVLKVDTRPIFMIASDLSPELIAMASEYNISRIHTGEISRAAMQGHLDVLTAEVRMATPVREALAKAATLRAHGDWAGSGKALALALKAHPENRRLACELTENLIYEARWSDAARVIARVPDTELEHPRAQHLKARCMMHAGKHEDAAALLSACKLISPHNVERLVDLGYALLGCEQITEALKNFEEALALDPTAAEARRGAARCKMAEGEVNEALALLRGASTPRELASIFNDAAILSIRTGRFDAGVALYHTAIGTIGPARDLAARLVFNLGLAYHKSSREAEALACFERASELDAGFEQPRHNARVLTALNEKNRRALVATPAPTQAEAEVVPDEGGDLIMNTDVDAETQL